MTDTYDKTRADGTQTIENAGIPQEFLSFTVGDAEYGVDIMIVREIKGWTDVTRLPNSVEYMRGVMNLRGLIIPIFDLRARFNQGMTEAHAKNVVIIMAVGERNIGLLVDTVSDILTVNNEDIKPAPETETAHDADYINGLISLENRMVVLLNIENLFETKIIERSIAEAA
jgi:purine-binding chemotaxis protein CheW